MEFHPLEELKELDAIWAQSDTKPQLIFKHSTRCPISFGAWKRTEAAANRLSAFSDTYFLDLIAHRSISNEIAERSGVIHESPQVIIFFKGRAIKHYSHHRIDPDQLIRDLQAL